MRLYKRRTLLQMLIRMIKSGIAMQTLQVKLLFLTVLALAVVLGQNDGRYRPPTPTTRRPYSFPTYFTTTRRPPVPFRPLVSDGRYRGNDGRYDPRADGRYIPGNDGRYIPSGEGKYNRGKEGIYSGGGGQYEGGGGQYTGGGGEYTGGGGQYTGDGGQYSAAGGDSTGGLGERYPSSTTTRPVRIDTTSRSTVSYRPSTATPYATRPTVKGQGTGEGGSGWHIIRSEKDELADGYHYLYETENGILGEESGHVEQRGEQDEAMKASGFYEYTGDDGNLYRVEYTADENGFIPQGDHIPAVPDSVRRTLEYLRANGELDR